MTLHPPAWNSFRDQGAFDHAPIQEGRLHVTLPFGIEPGAEPLYFRAAIPQFEAAIRSLPDPAEARRNEPWDLARHELNLAALLVCLVMEETEGASPAESGHSWPQWPATETPLPPSPLPDGLEVMAAAPGWIPPPDIPAVWDDAWMTPAPSWPMVESAWQMI
jgi:hypothetical protein